MNKLNKKTASDVTCGRAGLKMQVHVWSQTLLNPISLSQLKAGVLSLWLLQTWLRL